MLFTNTPSDVLIDNSESRLSKGKAYVMFLFILNASVLLVWF